MSIDVTSTAMSVAAAPSKNKISSSTSGSTDKATTDKSFQEEMSKVTVSEPEQNKQSKEDIKTSSKVDKSESKDNKSAKSEDKSKLKTSNEFEAAKTEVVNDVQILNGSIVLNNQDAFVNANSMLQNDIAQMIENTSSVMNLQSGIWSFSFGDGAKMNSLAMCQADAQFFLNLTDANDVSSRNMFMQAQSMLNSGVNSKEVAQNFKVSQALLEALSKSRENNQPLRIDFDKNISVILQVGKDGALAARFIPGDRAVEQYLKANIEALKATFDEKDLPYSELSYSNSSKQQNQRRRNNKQQGE